LCPAQLAVACGGWPDLRTRATIPPGHALWDRALLAWREQDTWTPGEHRAFWVALLPSWPLQRGGPQPTSGRLTSLALRLDARGCSREQIAGVLLVDADTVRRMNLPEARREQERRSFDLADPGERARFEADPHWGAAPLTPRVYDPEAEVPPSLYHAAVLASPPPRPESLEAMNRRAHEAAPCCLARTPMACLYRIALSLIIHPYLCVPGDGVLPNRLPNGPSGVPSRAARKAKTPA
jgi:hypothetical protein